MSVSNRFYRIKAICIDLGISHQTLYTHVASGRLPPLEKPNPLNTRISGYSEDTFRRIVNALSLPLQT